MGGQISWFSLLTFYLFTISRIINGIIFQQQKIGGGAWPGHIVPEFSLGLCFIYIYTQPAPYFLQCCCHSVTILQFLHQYSKNWEAYLHLSCNPSSQITTRVKFCTVRCAAVSNKIAAFYCFMFLEAKKQQDLIKFTPACSWRILEYFLHSYWTSSIDREGCATS